MFESHGYYLHGLGGASLSFYIHSFGIFSLKTWRKDLFGVTSSMLI